MISDFVKWKNMKLQAFYLINTRPTLEYLNQEIPYTRGMILVQLIKYLLFWYSKQYCLQYSFHNYEIERCVNTFLNAELPSKWISQRTFEELDSERGFRLGSNLKTNIYLLGVRPGLLSRSIRMINGSNVSNKRFICQQIRVL